MNLAEIEVGKFDFSTTLLIDGVPTQEMHKSDTTKIVSNEKVFGKAPSKLSAIQKRRSASSVMPNNFDSNRPNTIVSSSEYITQVSPSISSLNSELINSNPNMLSKQVVFSSEEKAIMKKVDLFCNIYII